MVRQWRFYCARAGTLVHALVHAQKYMRTGCSYVARARARIPATHAHMEIRNMDIPRAHVDIFMHMRVCITTSAPHAQHMGKVRMWTPRAHHGHAACALAPMLTCYQWGGS